MIENINLIDPAVDTAKPNYTKYLNQKKHLFNPNEKHEGSASSTLVLPIRIMLIIK